MILDDIGNDIPPQIASAAHARTSFDPELRGRQEIADYVAVLTGDWERLHKLADTDEKRAQLAAEFQRYREGYKKHRIALLQASSRCMSAMITGPANFPTARNRKRNNTADKRREELIEFRKRALAAIGKVLTPELQPIKSSDRDAVERLTADVAAAEAAHVRMVAANKAIRDNRKAGADAQVAALGELGFSRALATEILTPDCMGRIGFATYQLTNSKANIARLRERLEKVTAAKATPTTETTGANGVRLEDDPPGNRVRLHFTGRVPREVYEDLRRHGFRNARSFGDFCFSAYRNPNSLAYARAKLGEQANV